MTILSSLCLELVTNTEICIPSPRILRYLCLGQIIRSFLLHFHNQVLQTHNGVRQSSSNPPFDFTGGSVGNFFFAGCRTFFGSLHASIFLFSKVAGIPVGSRVIPAVLSQDRLILGAVLKDGTRIRGQYNIGHPKRKLPQSTSQTIEQRERSGSVSRHRHVVKSSLDSEEAIASLHPSPISTIHYLLHDPTWHRRDANAERQWSDQHEISLEPNPVILDAISNANCIVYGCGSLYTSVLPSLILEGVGEAISSRDVPKVLCLNGWHDAETSWVVNEGGRRVVKRMDAAAIVKAVADALCQRGTCGDNAVTNYVTHVLYPLGTEIEVDKLQQEEDVPIQVVGIESIPANQCSEGSRSGGLAHHRVFDPRALVDALLDLANG